MAARQPITESDVLCNIVAPNVGNLSAEVACAVLKMRLDETMIARLDELAEKNRQGIITEPERDEMRTYARVGDFLNLLHAKARRSLGEQDIATN